MKTIKIILLSMVLASCNKEETLIVNQPNNDTPYQYTDYQNKIKGTWYYYQVRTYDQYFDPGTTVTFNLYDSTSLVLSGNPDYNKREQDSTKEWFQGYNDLQGVPLSEDVR